MKTTWEKLAGGEDLPASIAWDVWRSKDASARRKLAAARNLPRDIEEEIASGTDPVLLEAWLTQRRERRLLNTVDEHLGADLRSALARQTHLDVTIRRRLAAFGEERVLLALLARADLEVDEHDDYLAGYVCSRELRRESYGANLLQMIGDHETTWLKLLGRIGPGQAALLADAASMTGRENIHKQSYQTLLRIAEKAPETELLRAASNLMRGPWLTPGEYLDLAEHPRLNCITRELRQRAATDTPTIIGELRRCSEGHLTACADSTHGDMLETLLPLIEQLDLPWAVVARSATRHDTGTARWNGFYRRLTGEEAGSLTRELTRLGQYDTAAELIDAVGRRTATLTPSVRAALAKRGSRHSLDGELGVEDIELLVKHYRPLGGLLDDPVLAGRVAQEVDKLGPEERETFYKLAGDWDGDLGTLLNAARYL